MEGWLRLGDKNTAKEKLSHTPTDKVIIEGRKACVEGSYAKSPKCKVMASVKIVLVEGKKAVIKTDKDTCRNSYNEASGVCALEK